MWETAETLAQKLRNFTRIYLSKCKNCSPADISMAGAQVMQKHQRSMQDLVHTFHNVLRRVLTSRFAGRSGAVSRRQVMLKTVTVIEQELFPTADYAHTVLQLCKSVHRCAPKQQGLQ